MNKYYVFLLFVASYSVAEEFHVQSNSLYSPNADSASVVLDAPLETSKKGVEDFFTHIFTHPHYSSRVLPYSFDHLEQLITYRAEPKFVEYVLRCFSNKVKASLYIQAASLDRFLTSFTQCIQQTIHLGSKGPDKGQKEELISLLYNRFLSEFERFKQDPESFFDQLSEDILAAITRAPTRTRSQIDSDEISHTIVLFLELCCNKLAWDSKDELKTWQTVVSLAEKFLRLEQVHLISSSDLENIYVSLVERYCFFLELMRADLSVEFLSALKGAVTAETEPFLETNRQHLLHTITLLEAQARAQQEYGYVSLQETKAAEQAVPLRQSRLRNDIHSSRRKKRRKRRNGKQ